MEADKRAHPVLVAAPTMLAMVAFAANSIFSRMALIDGQIDAASFALIRVASGAITLVLLVASSGGGCNGSRRAGGRRRRSRCISRALPSPI